MKPNPEVMAELAVLGNHTLCERLRGVYRVPVNDGAGLLNGSSEFVRQFETGAIQHEAARRIESLLAIMDAAIKAIEAGDSKRALELLS